MNNDLIGLSRRDTVAAGLGALLLSACQPAGTNTPAPAPQPLPPTLPNARPTPQAQQVGAAAAAFGLAMLRQLMIDAPQTTLVTSPLSLVADLLMLGQGAGGATADTLTQALRLPPGLSLSAAAAGFANIAGRMVPSANAEVAIADGVWADNKAGARPDFLQALQTQFGARASVSDLSAPGAVADINGFVSQATQGKIPTLLSNLPAGAMMVLVNALYFKGGWQTPFQASQTQAAAFTSANGATAPAQLMHQGGEFAYRETDQFQAVTLPYADTRFQLQLVLAKPGAQADAWMGGFGGHDVQSSGDVFLPRLDLTWGVDLTAVLGQLGLGPALGPPADYSGALTAPTGQLNVIQKCLLHVDEQGAEAAAATALQMPGGANPAYAPPPFVFRADRPFFAMLSETVTGAPLILAYVAAP